MRTRHKSAPTKAHTQVLACKRHTLLPPRRSGRVLLRCEGKAARLELKPSNLAALGEHGIVLHCKIALDHLRQHIRIRECEITRGGKLMVSFFVLRAGMRCKSDIKMGNGVSRNLRQQLAKDRFRFRAAARKPEDHGKILARGQEAGVTHQSLSVELRRLCVLVALCVGERRLMGDLPV